MLRPRSAALGGVVMLAGFVAAYADPATASSVRTSVSLFDDAGGALFDSSRPLAPDTPRSVCLSVGTSGAATGDAVTVAATQVGGELADHLRLTVEAGTGGSFAAGCAAFSGAPVFSGTLAAFAAASAGDGVQTGWSPAADPVRSFRLTAVIDDRTPPGLVAQGSFEWRLVPGAQPPPTPPPTTPTVTPTTGPTATLTPTVSPTPARTRTPLPDAGRTDLPSGGQGTGAVPGERAPDVVLGTTMQRMQELARRAQVAAVEVLRSPEYPLSAIALAVIFLLVQEQIDRRDPKLARATLTQRETEMVFADVFGSTR